jgi:dihydropteroate synthase-like protein
VPEDDLNLRVLIVTGILAKQTVEKYVTDNKLPAEVISLPVEVAALMSPQYVARMLRSNEISRFDKILLPGLIPGDVSVVEEATGITTYKGPVHAADIPMVVEAIDKVSLSCSMPASDLVDNAIRQQSSKELETIYKEEAELARNGLGISLMGNGRTVWIGPEFPPRILAEIVDASVSSDERIRALAKNFVECGAEIVDVGMVAGGGDPENAKRAVKVVKETVPTPVSIDTGDITEMRAAVEAGANLILSLNALTLVRASEFAAELPIVVTPTDREGSCPTDIARKLEQLSKNIELARSLGFKKIIADPVLSPPLMPSITESLVAYFEFKRKNPSTPILFGAANVTELIDCDSQGANMLLAAMACEVGASIILTTEASNKTRGSVRELSTAVKVTLLARRRRSPPKDLGYDLLVLKEKRKREEAYDRQIEDKAKVVIAEGKHKFTYDPRGCFRVLLDRDREEIVVFHYAYGNNRPDVVAKGVDPREISATIIENGLISRLDHAAYLGIELEKSAIALLTGGSYVQDLPLFTQLLGKTSLGNSPLKP